MVKLSKNVDSLKPISVELGIMILICAYVFYLCFLVNHVGGLSFYCRPLMIYGIHGLQSKNGKWYH